MACACSTARTRWYTLRDESLANVSSATAASTSSSSVAPSAKRSSTPILSCCGGERIAETSSCMAGLASLLLGVERFLEHQAQRLLTPGSVERERELRAQEAEGPFDVHSVPFHLEREVAFTRAERGERLRQ